MTKTGKKNHENYYAPNVPNWLGLKQQLLVEYGTLEDRIDNLKHLFYYSYDKSDYYHQLKGIVDTGSWNSFYHELLANVSGYKVLDDIAPFLIEEGEFDWLFRLISNEVEKDSTDYRTPLVYAGALRQTHFDEMQAILVRTVRAYAADRFLPKKQVKSSKYSYFRADLESLSEIGYSQIQKEIVEYLLQEYRFRPALAKELRLINLITDNRKI